LIQSFFQFSNTLLISQEQFNVLIQKTSSSERGIAAAVHYAICHQLEIDPELIVQNRLFQSNYVFVGLMKYFRKYSGIEGLPQSLTQFIVSKIDRPIEPDLIASHNELEASLVYMDPDFFFKHFLGASENFSFRGIKLLSRLVFECSFHPVLLNELIAIHLSVFQEMQPMKKKVLLVRFIESVIISLRRRNLFMESDMIASLVCVSFEALTASTKPILEKELADLLRIILPRTQNVARFMSFLSASYSIFVDSLTALFVNKGQPIFVDMFTRLLDCERPSEIARALRCLQSLTIPGLPSVAVEIMNSSIEILFPTLVKLSTNFLTARESVTFAERLFEFGDGYRIPDGFFEVFAAAFLGNADRPCFEESLPIARCFVMTSSALIDSVFNIQFSNSVVLVSLYSLFESRPNVRVALQGLSDRILAFFMEHPQPGSTAILMKIVGETNAVEKAGCVVLNYRSDWLQFLPMFVLITKLAALSEMVKQLLLCKVEQMKPRSRALALTCGDVAKSFYLAAAETDDEAELITELNELVVNK
jgi:hypothetical protein